MHCKYPNFFTILIDLLKLSLWLLLIATENYMVVQTSDFKFKMKLHYI